MDDEARAAYESQSLTLRADLKQWEGDWANAHAGKKPGRGDIKQNPDIARKYKQYNRLRDILACRIPPPATSDPVREDHSQQQQQQQRQYRKRTQSDVALPPPQTPSKKARPARTSPRPQPPEHTTNAMANDDPGTPSTTQAVTPLVTALTSISPTPQKDGRVLGLFDLLGRTPSRSATDTTAAINSLSGVATPSKQRTFGSILPADTTTSSVTAATPTTARFATTPQSKHTNSQTLFPPTSTTAATPSRGHDKENKLFKTPSNSRVTKSRVGNTPTSSTPSFLRRRTFARSITAPVKSAGLAPVDEHDHVGDQGAGGVGAEDEAWKEMGPLRLPRKLGVSIGRSLSSVVAGLRKLEDEAFDDDEEALREMEREMDGDDGSTPAAAPGSGAGAKSGMRIGTKQAASGATGDVEVEDGQIATHPDRQPPAQGVVRGHQPAGSAHPGLLSGFDEDALFDSPDEEGHSLPQPLRQFKKRGQKRTTRLVKMRPTRARRPTQQTENLPAVSDEDEGEDVDDNLIPETQLNPATVPSHTAGGDDNLLLSDDDLNLSDFDADSSGDSDSGTVVQPKGKAKAAQGKLTKNKITVVGGAAASKEEEEGGVIKRAVRKVKATAHANFKRLKLRNTGSKGGPGHNSRFRRRR
ncbi:DNA replication/checkpoint protein [Chaetomium sp. MPI-SDFR-AT-0129]|nr:DNA replication/checkpoint protein [Chaetomium sp. MPI-SDFR-AT-0129]